MRKLRRQLGRTPCTDVASFPTRDTLHSQSGVAPLHEDDNALSKILGSTTPLLDADPGYVELVLTHLKRPQCNQLINLQVRTPILRTQGPLHITRDAEPTMSAPYNRIRYNGKGGTPEECRYHGTAEIRYQG